ncbi:MAG: sugar phosphate nucleotidyltransferase [Candidatus Bathyarchaeota archaeon]|nr:sugar phosphate nucleotidyltransferase [Candidatus Bathyarchaeota archaeon]
MKVVLFCGGLGMRLHPTTELVPKPLVPVGEKPILWHMMKYYSHFGHNDFILCLGYKGERIKRYFLDYDECLSSDFVLSNGGRDRKLIEKNTDNWRITFVDTGLYSNIGQRLKAVQKHLDGQDMFLANYSDGLTDLNLPKYIEYFIKKNKIGCLLTVKPFHSYHAITSRKNGLVSNITPLVSSDIRINGGYFIFKNQIFDYIGNGEDLVDEPFKRLIAKKELVAYNYDGFWANMDNYKDKQQLDEWAGNGNAKWQVWLTKSQG